MTENKHKKPTVNLAEVARAAGVSKMTASRVLRDVAGFSEQTRVKVMREVERLGYVPNKLAATFGSETASTLVGVSVPHLTKGLFGEVVEGIDRALVRLGYQTVIGASEHSPDIEETWLRALLAWRPAGLILTGRTRSPAAQELLRSSGVPLVEIWELNTRPLDASVGFSHFDCGHEMGRYILNRGRRRIGYVGAEAESPGMGQLRQMGFEKALADGGHPLAASEVLHDRPGYYAGFYGAETLLSREPNLDALYFQDDAMAVGGLFYCQSKGLDAPGDIGIAGWGGMEIASVLPRRLTTTTVATRGLGKAAAENLVARIKGEAAQDVIDVPTTLVPGATL